MRTEDKIDEWMKWYFEHRNDGRSIDQEVEFIKKSIDGLFECLVESRYRQSQTEPSVLYRPRALVLR